MPLSDADYIDILTSLRRLLQDNGLGAIEDRLTRNLRGSDGPYWDLVSYLKFLIEEISLGSDRQLRAVLARFHEVVEAEPGHSIQGIQVSLTPEERGLYQTESLNLDAKPETQEIIVNLIRLLDELHVDRTQRPEGEERE